MNNILLKLKELKPNELDKIVRTSSIVYLPLGTLEWHERHLPFGLDAMVSYELCKRACMETGGCVIPPLYFGTDREHVVDGKIFHGMDARAGRILPGSIYYLPRNVFHTILKQISENIAHQGFKKLVIVSAHSGTAQQEVLEELAKENFGDLRVFIFPGKLFVGGIDHAGKIETSLMLAVNDSLVELDRLKEPLGPISGEHPTLASKEEGARRMKDIVKQIVQQVQ